ncbi:hypothetical protein C8R44DRAFT_803402 [Mycena epipterygia]|nr:hypothetical protein C8R44DRAFT_803402 [Mycena epipterygia]
MIVGKASGKRSLAAEMDRDIAAKRKRQENAAPAATQSRFFTAPITSTSRVEADTPVAGPSRPDASKENVPALNEDDEDVYFQETDLDVDLEWDSTSLVVLPERDDDMHMVDVEELDDGVEQEDGYISPTPSRSRDAEDLSSPLRPGATPPPRKRVKKERVVNCEEVDAVSSPPEEARGRQLRLPALSLCRSRSRSPSGTILVAASPDPPRTVLVGPDLRDAFGDERTSDIDCFEDEVSGSGSTPTPSPSPRTPDDDVSGDLVLALMDPEEAEAQASVARAEVVAAGWRHQFANRGGKAHAKGRETPTLRRRETNVTPAGRHLPINAHLRPHPYLYDSVASSVPSKSANAKARPLQGRRSLTFLDPVRPAQPSRGQTSLVVNDNVDDAVARAQSRLAQFRYPP